MVVKLRIAKVQPNPERNLTFFNAHLSALFLLSPSSSIQLSMIGLTT